MRLIELDPRWFAEPGRHGQGIVFRCPHCPESKTTLAVAFKNPLDGGAPIQLHTEALYRLIDPEYWDGDARCMEAVPPGVHWTRDGASFETLTIAPSVDASAAGHWHGFVRQGDCQ
jgi:hypothetical protein